MPSVTDVASFAVPSVLFGIVVFYWIQWIRENRTQDERDRDDIVRTRHEINMERKEAMKVNDELLQKIEKLENSVSELLKGVKEVSKTADKETPEVEMDSYAICCAGRIGWVVDLWYCGDSDDVNYPDLWREGVSHEDVQQYDTIEEAMEDAKRLKVPTDAHHPPQVVRVQWFKTLQEGKKPEIKANPHSEEDQKKDSPDINRYVIVQRARNLETHESRYWSSSRVWACSKSDATSYLSLDNAVTGLADLYRHHAGLNGVQARYNTHDLPTIVPYHEA